MRSAPTRLAALLRRSRPSVVCLVLGGAAVPSAAGAGADLAVAIKTPSTPILPGWAAAFTVDVGDLGPDPSDGVVLTCQASGDYAALTASPSGSGPTCAGESPVVCQLGSLQPDPVYPYGATEVTLQMTSTSSDAGGSMQLSCSVSAATADPGPAPNVASATAVVDPSSAAADLTVGVSEGPRAPSGAHTITIQVQNVGPSFAPTTTVVAGIEGLTLGSGSSARTGPPYCTSDLDTCVGLACLVAAGEPLRVVCDLGDLAAGQTATASFDAYLGVGSWTAFADASSLAPDPTPADANAAVTIVVDRSPPPRDTSSSGCGTAGTPSAPLVALFGAALPALTRRRRGLTARAARRAA